MLSMTSDMLDDLGYDAITAADGAESCRKIDNGQFDMIFTDLNMPKMDGIEFSERARQNPACKFVPIVMLSCEDNESKIKEAKKVEISTFLNKPVKELHLKTILQVNAGH